MEYPTYILIGAIGLAVLILINLILIPVCLVLISSKIKRILKLLRKMYKESKDE